MSRKRNEYLDISDEEEDIGRESDVEQDTRFGTLPSKRRRLNADEDDALAEEQDVGDDSHDEDEEEPLKQKSAADYIASSTNPLKPLTPTQLAASQAKAKKTGVIYISRIPPFMKPSVVRSLLSPYGEILRIFLTPEPTPAYQKRIRAGGNKKRSYVDGWVEFASKKKAKIVAETLNGNIVGGKKGSWYHDDIWNMKYLRGFKWNDLMEQVQNEEREREGRLRLEIDKEAKHRRAFLENLELDKRQKGMDQKRSKKKERQDAGEVKGLDPSPEALGGRRGEMKFLQKEVKIPKADDSNSGQPETQRVLSKIF